MKPLTHLDGSRRVTRRMMRTGEAYHYLARLFPLTTLCGLAAPYGSSDTSDHYSNGKPIPICGHCRKRAEKAGP